MTRINCIPVEELTDKHLGAEYRELPRLFALVLGAQQRNESPYDKRNPTRYILGKGHVRFFYRRLGFIQRRFYDIVAECKRRGRKVNFEHIPRDITSRINTEWFNDWEPTADDIELNRQRINLRLAEAAARSMSK